MTVAPTLDECAPGSCAHARAVPGRPVPGNWLSHARGRSAEAIRSPNQIAVLINRQCNANLAGAAGDVKSSLRFTGTSCPDITIIDLELGASSAFQAIREILCRRPAAEAIGLLTWGVDRLPSDVLAAGVIAVVAKDDSERSCPLIRLRDPRCRDRSSGVARDITELSGKELKLRHKGNGL
jgi:hypothetical protein